ncbi:division/cell wall cluster transcriptional repressor MraZ [Neotabrizicola sp. VNH66]|uniref:division/cell wall cluster transcriptional repressor MraZ n=1 Tax=Neotabrizicola sp. VNH66 TaxID=3400918 RepID=UPI003C000263
MAEAFRGEFYQKVDGKQRVTLPAAFRQILLADDPDRTDPARPRVYLVYGGKNRNYVEGYSKAGADALAAQIEAMEIGSKARDRAERDLISRSVMVEIEPDGRFVLPPKVREKIGLTGPDFASGGEVAYAGTTNRFRLYRRDVYDAENEDDDDDDDDGVDPLALVGRAAKGA